MDRLDAFSVFAAVAGEGGFAAGARRLGRSPAAVTRAVAGLEAELGTLLFRRTTRVVSLTDAGRRFLDDVKRILADVDESVAHARGAHAAVRGGLLVTASVMFGRMHVTPILLGFLDEHPDVRIRALLVDRVVDIVEEGIDVAVRIAHLRDSALRAIKVAAVRRVLCASPAYLAKHGRPRVPDDLRAHEILAFSSDAPPRDWAFPRARRVRRVAIEPRLVTNSTEATLAAALAGHGITRALSYQVEADVRAGRLVVVLADHEPPPIPVPVVLPGGWRARARARAFVDLGVVRRRGAARLDPRMRR
jgi:DNA-binding transcriptional LysR family regulator